MQSYLTQLEAVAKRQGVPLIEGFRQAGVATTTYYRARKGIDLRYDTAVKVWEALCGAQGSAQATD